MKNNLPLKYEQVKQFFINKHGRINQKMFDIFYNEALSNNISPEEIVDKIKSYQPQPVNLYVNSLSSFFSKILINDNSFERDDKYSYIRTPKSNKKGSKDQRGIKWSSFITDWLEQPDFINDFTDYMTNKYTFFNYKADLGTNLLNFGTLKFLSNNDKYSLHLDDISLDPIINDENGNPVITKDLLINQQGGSKYLVFNTAYDTSRSQYYFEKWKLLPFAMANVFSKDPLQGVCQINRDKNSIFTIDNIPISSIKTKAFDHHGVLTDLKENEYLFTEEFKTKVKHLYEEVNLKLKSQGLLNNVTSFKKTPIKDKLAKPTMYDNLPNYNSDFQTIFNKNNPIKYFDLFGNKELNKDEKTYKFYKSIIPSPSQINGLIYLNKDKLPYDKIPKTVYEQIILDKYGLEKVEDKQGKIQYVDKPPFPEHFQNRLDFGNHMESYILEEFARRHPELNVHADKRTLKRKVNGYDVYFDIDGYTGVDLNKNNIDQIIEIKNTSSVKNFENPNNLIDSYRLQMTYYSLLLSPKNGIKLIGCLGLGNQSKIQEIDFIPETKDYADLKEAIQQYLFTLNEMSQNPEFTKTVGKKINQIGEKINVFNNTFTEDLVQLQKIIDFNKQYHSDMRNYPTEDINQKKFSDTDNKFER